MPSRKSLVPGAILIVAIGLSSKAQARSQNAPVPPMMPPTSASVSLTETHWNLTELNGSAVTVDSPTGQPYIYLQEPGDKLSGSGGCNRLFGSFDLSGSSLQFHSVASTLMACPGNSMEHESGLLEALRLTNTFQISGNVLQLRVEDRILARFEPEKKK